MKSNCIECNGRKYILVQKKWRPCVCLIEHRRLVFYRKANIPILFYKYTWSDFLKDFPKMKVHVKSIAKIVERIKNKNIPKKYLYIKGDSGSGKQALISLILKDIINLSMQCRFVSIDELIAMEFDNEQKEEREKIYTQYSVVCLRLGTVIQNKYARYVLEKFYQTRRNNNLYCIFTSRVDVESMKGLYGMEMSKIMDDSRRVLKIGMAR